MNTGTVTMPVVSNGSNILTLPLATKMLTQLSSIDVLMFGLSGSSPVTGHH